jgi:hypothetical protein
MEARDRRGDNGETDGPFVGLELSDRHAALLDKPIDGVWASDHFGVMAELTIPKPNTTAH